jgi:hypothetical protein
LSEQRQIPLSGIWRVRIDPTGEADWSAGAAGEGWAALRVPGAWERQGVAHRFDGPVWYAREFDLLDELRGHTFVLRFEAVSFHAEVWVNGRRAGDHAGMWTPFEFDISGLLDPGRRQRVAVRVHKPGRRYPLRQALAGFLPDVSMPFGGIWRPVRLVAYRTARIAEVHASPDVGSGEVIVRVTVETAPGAGGGAAVKTVLRAADGRAVTGAAALDLRAGRGEASITLPLPGAATWTPESPALHELRVSLSAAGRELDARTRRVGFRDLRVEEDRILLDGRPTYLRGVLHWGWYPETLAPTPDRERIRAEIVALKERGFNLVKHCLYVPVPEYADLCDELGMLQWQELPMWLPETGPGFAELVEREYEGIVRGLRDHPSVAVWTLGCELSAAVEAPLLERLYGLVRRWTGSPLVRDNSGSGEAYGGLLNEYADFYDYHFYTDPHFYEPLMDRFAARWRERKPWLYGEFCDADEIRDLAAVKEAAGGALPWWLVDEARGIRWPVAQHEQEERLRAAGLWERLPDLVKASRHKAAVYRKLVLEKVRCYPQVSGYVLTSIRDTPVTTSALFDDLGRPKENAAGSWRSNGETVLAAQFDNARAWIGGGDRVVYRDPWNYRGGGRVRLHVVISHWGARALPGAVRWTARTAVGECAVGVLERVREVGAGSVRWLGVIEFDAPAVEEAARLDVTAELAGVPEVSNQWRLWLHPEPRWPVGGEFAVVDPGGLLADLPRVAPETGFVGPGEKLPAIVVTTDLDTRLLEHVAGGGRAIFLQPEAGRLPVHRRPFWREALQLHEPGPLLAPLPGDGLTDTQVYGIATDTVLRVNEVTRALAALAPAAGEAGLEPAMRRLDARSFEVTDYVLEASIGTGRLVISTLRLHGGLGDQPTGISRNLAGQALLAGWLRYLSGGSPESGR